MSGLKQILNNAYFVCNTCGLKYGAGIQPNMKRNLFVRWVENECDVCGNATEVADVKEFGYLKYK